MLNIVFRGLKSSDLATELVLAKVTEIVAKFPKLRGCKVNVTLSMENSPRQAGPDVFGFKFRIARHKFRDIIIEKKNINLYLAAQEVCEALLERLNRDGDKRRIMRRQQARHLARGPLVQEENP
jgi:ribosome-associated translation inhibitor RaiA